MAVEVDTIITAVTDDIDPLCLRVDANGDIHTQNHEGGYVEVLGRTSITPGDAETIAEALLRAARIAKEQTDENQ
jgi:hypothetical protein